MQPRTITDFLPLIELNQSQLNKIAILAEDELDQVPERHRIYYFSKELKVFNNFFFCCVSLSCDNHN